MKLINVETLQQKKKKFYFCVADPRDIIKAVNIPKKGMAQDFQRPWTEKE